MNWPGVPPAIDDDGQIEIPGEFTLLAGHEDVALLPSALLVDVGARTMGKDELRAFLSCQIVLAGMCSDRQRVKYEKWMQAWLLGLELPSDIAEADPATVRKVATRLLRGTYLGKMVLPAPGSIARYARKSLEREIRRQDHLSPARCANNLPRPPYSDDD